MTVRSPRGRDSHPPRAEHPAVVPGLAVPENIEHASNSASSPSHHPISDSRASGDGAGLGGSGHAQASHASPKSWPASPKALSGGGSHPRLWGKLLASGGTPNQIDGPATDGVVGEGRGSEGGETGRRASVGFTVMIETAMKQQKPRPCQSRTSSKGTPLPPSNSLAKLGFFRAMRMLCWKEISSQLGLRD